MADLSTLYNDQFYKDQISGSYKSGQVYAKLLAQHFTPATVVDVGCGRGTWLKAFAETGAKDLVGFDGAWNSQGNMVDPAITFVQCNLNLPITTTDNYKFDLAMSLEVAEHLEIASAGIFVQSLTTLSDVVLFGAAFTAQGGRNHINEQPASYWAAFFAGQGFVPFDLFRASVWGDPAVEFWYQQNTFLYVRRDSAAYAHFVTEGLQPMSNIAFMDCVHPALYKLKLR
jgi:SAM-dependent methyltransferase